MRILKQLCEITVKKIYSVINALQSKPFCRHRFADRISVTVQQRIFYIFTVQPASRKINHCTGKRSYHIIQKAVARNVNFNVRFIYFHFSFIDFANGGKHLRTRRTVGFEIVFAFEKFRRAFKLFQIDIILYLN